tara:strand:+ start:1724 stop:1948 length:225 start_codon:yes stop_codon:yes gene_type:complete
MRKITLLLATTLLLSSSTPPEILCTSANYRITKTSGGTFYVKHNGITRRYHSNALGLMPVDVSNAINQCQQENN